MPKPRLTEEEKKQRRRDCSYRYFEQKRARGGKRLGRIGEEVPEERTPTPKYETVYVAWVIPLRGDPIQIGPYKSKHVTLKARFKTVRKLIEENNARDFDIRLLGMHEESQLEEDD